MARKKAAVVEEQLINYTVRTEPATLRAADRVIARAGIGDRSNVLRAATILGLSRILVDSDELVVASKIDLDKIKAK